MKYHEFAALQKDDAMMCFIGKMRTTPAPPKPRINGQISCG
jgi:hypothetical protein